MTTGKDFERTFEFGKNLIIHLKREPLVHGERLDKRLTQNFRFIPVKHSAVSCRGITEDPYFLPKIFAVLNHLCGPCDLCYDEYQGSYSFAFILSVLKNGCESQYIYRIFHSQADVVSVFFHMILKEDFDQDLNLYQPHENRLESIDTYAFNLYFFRYCLDYLEETQYVPAPFVKSAESNLLLFGYFNNQYFLESFNDYIKYNIKENYYLNELFPIKGLSNFHQF